MGSLNLKWLTTITPSNRHRNRAMASILGGFTITLTLILLFAVDSAKDVYAANYPDKSPGLERRDITDRHGTVIATSAPGVDLWIIPNRFWISSPANPNTNSSTLPRQLTDKQRRDDLLKSLDEWPQLRNIVDGRLNNYGKSDARQKILAWGVKPEVAEKITATGLTGLKLTPRPIRNYPQGSLFAHALGFASLSDMAHGQDGLELAANDELVLAQKKGLGKSAMPLQTTLDFDIQTATSKALSEGVAANGAIGGAAVVIDAENGKIRSMVSWPGFDGNNDATFRNPYQPDHMLNRARGINFPIGSLITPLLAAHMIDNGRMKPATDIAIGKKFKIGNITIVDTFPAETLSLAEIIAKSSNIGQAKLALNLPIAELRYITRNLGVGEPLQIHGLTGNIDYETIDWMQWTPQMQAQPGLHINTNLLQAMRAYLPIANGGRLDRISLIEVPEASTPTATRALSDATVKAMRDILISAAGPTGTAPLAQVPGVVVAGKTGTIVSSNDHLVIAFVGMAPADKPRWLIGVLLEFPKQKARLAGNTAVPIFTRILEKAIASEMFCTNE